MNTTKTNLLAAALLYEARAFEARYEGLSDTPGAALSIAVPAVKEARRVAALPECVVEKRDLTQDFQALLDALTSCLGFKTFARSKSNRAQAESCKDRLSAHATGREVQYPNWSLQLQDLRRHREANPHEASFPLKAAPQAGDFKDYRRVCSAAYGKPVKVKVIDVDTLTPVGFTFVAPRDADRNVYLTKQGVIVSNGGGVQARAGLGKLIRPASVAQA